MEYTTNYNLKKPEDNDLYTQEVQNDNMDIIDAALHNQSAGSGELSSLTTTEKTSLVGAINELDGNIGDLSGLTTTAKTNLVNAVNELSQKIPTTMAWDDITGKPNFLSVNSTDIT